eukprot:PITA_25472
MKTGRGIVHYEMPTRKGVYICIQLQVNISSKDKMIEPTYQELDRKDIPKVEKDGVRVVVIAREGEAIFGDISSTAVNAHHTVQLRSGNGSSVWNKSNIPRRFVLIGGQPLNEPAIQYGPFVMNNKQEIIQAIEYYKCSKNGLERVVDWRSNPIGLNDAE